MDRRGEKKNCQMSSSDSKLLKQFEKFIAEFKKESGANTEIGNTYKINGKYNSQ